MLLGLGWAVLLFKGALWSGIVRGRPVGSGLHQHPQRMTSGKAFTAHKNRKGRGQSEAGALQGPTWGPTGWLGITQWQMQLIPLRDCQVCDGRRKTNVAGVAWTNIIQLWMEEWGVGGNNGPHRPIIQLYCYLRFLTLYKDLNDQTNLNRIQLTAYSFAIHLNEFNHRMLQVHPTGGFSTFISCKMNTNVGICVYNYIS